MITTPLAPPPPRDASRGRSTLVARTAGGLLLAFAAVALAFWIVALSPFGFRRWDPLGFGSSVSVRQAGTYVVYLEYEGAATRKPDIDVDVSVRATGGRRISVSPVDSGGFTYDTPWQEGREVARFNAPGPGTYNVVVLPATSDGVLDLLAAGDVRAAVSRDTSASWVATPLGLVALVLLPAFVGLLLLASARPPGDDDRVRPTEDPRAPGATPASASVSSAGWRSV